MTVDSWYPRSSEYWALGSDLDSYPWRHGDIFTTPPSAACVDASGKPWAFVMPLHPSCELGAKAKPESFVLLARVRPTSDIAGGDKELAAVRCGWQLTDGGPRIAYAHTFWLPPLPGHNPDQDWFVDFKFQAPVSMKILRQSSPRVAAMTHDARVTLLRRELYYRYRWTVPYEDVKVLEMKRISTDQAFLGPRPTWAALLEA